MASAIERMECAHNSRGWGRQARLRAAKAVPCPAISVVLDRRRLGNDRQDDRDQREDAQPDDAELEVPGANVVVSIHDWGQLTALSTDVGGRGMISALDEKRLFTG